MKKILLGLLLAFFLVGCSSTKSIKIEKEVINKVLEGNFSTDELNKRRNSGGYMPMVDPNDYIIWETIEDVN